MHGSVNALCYFGCVERAVKETINVATLVCSGQKIVELPHINVRAVRAKVFIADVSFSHCIDLGVCYQQPWNIALYLLRECLIQSHFSKNLTELVSRHACVAKCLH